MDLPSRLIYESLHILQVNKSLYLQPKVTVQLLLLLSGDIELCPGPQNETFDADIQNITNCRGMKFFHLNVRGLWTNLAHIFDILSTHRNIDIFAVSETHISDEPGELFDTDGYNFVHKNRTNGKGGVLRFTLTNV